MYAYVKNYFNEVDENGKIPSFIKIDSSDQFYLYEFIQTLLLLKGENPYQYNNTLNLQSILSNDISDLSSSISDVINKFAFLGNIDFKIKRMDNYNLGIVINIILNKKINNKSMYTYEFPIGDLYNGAY